MLEKRKSFAAFHEVVEKKIVPVMMEAIRTFGCLLLVMDRFYRFSIVAIACFALCFLTSSPTLAGEVLVVTPHESKIMNTETRKVFDNMSIQQRAELLTISSSLQEQIDLMPLSRRVALIHFIKEINTNIDPEAADYQSLQPFVRRMALELSRALQFSTHDNEYFDKYYNSFEAFMAKDDEKKKKYSLKDYSRAKREQEKLRILGERRKYLDKLLGQERLRYASPENVALRDTIQPVIDVIQGQINIIDTQIDRMFEEE